MEAPFFTRHRHPRNARSTGAREEGFPYLRRLVCERSPCSSTSQRTRALSLPRWDRDFPSLFLTLPASSCGRYAGWGAGSQPMWSSTPSNAAAQMGASVHSMTSRKKKLALDNSVLVFGITFHLYTSLYFVSLDFIKD